MPTFKNTEGRKQRSKETRKLEKDLRGMVPYNEVIINEKNTSLVTFKLTLNGKDSYLDLRAKERKKIKSGEQEISLTVISANVFKNFIMVSLGHGRKGKTLRLKLGGTYSTPEGISLTFVGIHSEYDMAMW